MKSLNYISKRLFLPILALFGYFISLGQENKIPAHHSDILAVEIGMYGSVGNITSGLTSTYGMRVFNYFHIKDFKAKRNSSIGLAVPMGMYISEPDLMPENIQTMASIAALFRTQVQLIPGKDKWWIFLGAGPEYRWLDRFENRSIFMFQAEMGLNRSSDSSFFKHFEIGTTSSFLPNRYLIQGLTSYTGLFVRLNLF